MQLDEKSSQYPAVTINNSEIEGENLLNDYKTKTARARRKVISPVHYLIELEFDDKREKISNLVEYICGSDEAQNNSLEMLPSIYGASFKTKYKFLNILPSLYEVKETLPHANEITLEQQKLAQLITLTKEKQKSPPQISQIFKDSVSLLSSHHYN